MHILRISAQPYFEEKDISAGAPWPITDPMVVYATFEVMVRWSSTIHIQASEGAVKWLLAFCRRWFGVS